MLQGCRGVASYTHTQSSVNRELWSVLSRPLLIALKILVQKPDVVEGWSAFKCPRVCTFTPPQTDP